MSMEYEYDDPDHLRFVEDMEEAGLEVEHYRGRFFWEGPSVQVDDLQDALGATMVRCQLGQPGPGLGGLPEGVRRRQGDR